jgi:hypothetical protein
VFTPLPDNTAAFRVVQVGLENGDVSEVLGGLQEGDRVITTGAASLRDGDRIQLAGARSGGRRGQGGSDASSASNTGGDGGARRRGQSTQGATQ